MVSRKNLLLTSKKAVSLVQLRRLCTEPRQFSQGAHTELLPRRRQSRTTRFSWCTRVRCSWKGRVGRTFRRIHWAAQTVCISYYPLSSPDHTSFLQLGWNEFTYILFSAKVDLNAFDHQMLSHFSQKLVIPTRDTTLYITGYRHQSWPRSSQRLTYKYGAYTKGYPGIRTLVLTSYRHGHCSESSISDRSCSEKHYGHLWPLISSS